MLRADVQASFFRSYLWIAVACVLGIAWCVFDTQVTYPGKQVIAEAYESLPDTVERGVNGFNSQRKMAGRRTRPVSLLRKSKDK